MEEMLQQDSEFKDFRCVNLAVDQMTTFDFLKREPARNGWRQYENARIKTNFTDPQDQGYYVSEDGNIYPVEQLKQLKNVRYVLVSVGGNDVYLRPEVQVALGRSLLPLQSYARSRVAEQFGSRVRTIMAAVQAAVPDAVVIPVIVYHPAYKFSLLEINEGITGWVLQTFQRLLLSYLVSPMSRQIITYARDHKLPVIDISRTFNPKVPEHYGSGGPGRQGPFAYWSGAEPSNVSTPFIARLALTVMKDFKAGASNSVVYYGETEGNNMVGVMAENNIGAYPVLFKFGARQWRLRLLYGRPVRKDSIGQVRRSAAAAEGRGEGKEEKAKLMSDPPAVSEARAEHEEEHEEEGGGLVRYHHGKPQRGAEGKQEETE